MRGLATRPSAVAAGVALSLRVALAPRGLAFAPSLLLTLPRARSLRPPAGSEAAAAQDGTADGATAEAAAAAEAAAEDDDESSSVSDDDDVSPDISVSHVDGDDSVDVSSSLTVTESVDASASHIESQLENDPRRLAISCRRRRSGG